MTFAEIAAAAKAQNRVGAQYQKSGHTQFRDRLTVYRDGKILFERFCYGEAAGLVFEMWGTEGEPGQIAWNYDACPNSRKTDAPRAITGGGETALLLDEKQAPWERTELLKSDAAHGYGALGGILGRLFKKG